MTPFSSSRRTVLTAMVCAAAATAQFVGGKATRDALFLAHWDVTSLPVMTIATSAACVALVAANSRAASRISPARLVPASFVASAGLFAVEWLLASLTPRIAAVLVYLHISGLGPVVLSGFWLVSSERFDPRTAKRRFGQILSVGTLGGLLGGLLAVRVAAALDVAAMLPCLAVLN